MSLVAWLLRGLNPFLGAPVALLAYVAALFATGELDRSTIAKVQRRGHAQTISCPLSGYSITMTSPVRSGKLAAPLFVVHDRVVSEANALKLREAAQHEDARLVGEISRGRRLAQWLRPSVREVPT